MLERRGRVLAAIAIGIADAALFVALLYFGQAIADSANPRAPFWLGPAWVIFSFPARYVYLLPALNHPFGFGEHEDLTLYVIAALNGLIWAGLVYLVARAWGQRRRANR
jgi:hypothetical protein